MKKLRILVRKDPTFGSCPKCEANFQLKKSRSRSIWETIVKNTTFYKTYRCKECGWRGMISTIRFANNAFLGIIVYGFLLALLVFLITVLANFVS